MSETSKARQRRVRERFFDRLRPGNGIDIGCGTDPITPEVRQWDAPDGNAQHMKGVADETFDFVYSSHCLEHIPGFFEGLQNWWRILKAGGYLILYIPDQLLYEQGHWPSAFNADHRWRFTLDGVKLEHSKSINIIEEINRLPNSRIIYAKLCDANYDYNALKDPNAPSQCAAGAETSIEIVAQKYA